MVIHLRAPENAAACDPSTFGTCGAEHLRPEVWSRLPSDVVLQVFELSAVLGTNAAIALVSRDLRRRILSRLFDTVVIHSTRNIEWLRGPLSLSNLNGPQPTLAQLVKRVFVRYSRSEKPSWGNSDIVDGHLRRIFPEATIHAHVGARSLRLELLRYELLNYDSLVYTPLGPSAHHDILDGSHLSSVLSRISICSNSSMWPGILDVVSACLKFPALTVVQLHLYTSSLDLESTRVCAGLRLLCDPRIWVARVDKDPEASSINDDCENSWVSFYSDTYPWGVGEQIFA
ncbi:hypothetical protein AURDEDRAFT_174349 [Auricularia subglabra TFB-10046 SS5]|nr:hypothetical protein AURDEDRAFT_174349 [Auricularia subglabra TFB-10046 SS5]